MVWRSFAAYGPRKLVIMDRKVNSKVFQDILLERPTDEGEKRMSVSTRQWSKPQKSINRRMFQSQSLDVNPIEMLCPDLETFTSGFPHYICSDFTFASYFAVFMSAQLSVLSLFLIDCREMSLNRILRLSFPSGRCQQLQNQPIVLF